LKDRRLFIVAAIIAVLALLLFGCIFKWKSEMTSPYLLFLTLVAIFWYSWETRGLKKQMVLQNEFSLRPRLVFYAIAGRQLRVKNIGNGAALNIHVDDYLLEFPGIMNILYAFECQNILEPGEHCQLFVKTKTGAEIRDAEQMELVQLEPLSAPRTVEIGLSFKNVIGEEYKADTSKLGKEMLQK
jgi:hypothetical protein